MEIRENACHQLKTPSGRLLWIYRKTYEKREYVDIRWMYLDADGNVCPSKKGIMVPLDLVDFVATALTDPDIIKGIDTPDDAEHEILKISEFVVDQ